MICNAAGLKLQLLQFTERKLLYQSTQLLLFAFEAVLLELGQRTVSAEVGNEHKVFVAELNVVRNLGFAFNLDDVHRKSYVFRVLCFRLKLTLRKKLSTQ